MESTLLHAPAFANWLEIYVKRHDPNRTCQIYVTPEGSHAACKLCLFRDILVRYWDSKHGKYEHIFDELWGYIIADWDQTGEGNRQEQQDSAEFWNELFWQFAEQMQLDSSLELEKLFAHHLIRVKSCIEASQDDDKNCATPKVALEPGTMLSLPFPHSETKGRRKAAHLSDAIVKFFSEVKMQVPCDTCHHERGERLQLANVPEVLMLHLNRIEFNKEGKRLKKNRKPIRFDQTLELDSEIFRKGLVTEKDVYYELFSVIMHHGSAFGSGHYTSFCKGPGGRWVSCDDRDITRTENFHSWAQSKTNQSQAYMFAYRRLDQKPSEVDKPERTPGTVTRKSEPNGMNNGDKMDVDKPESSKSSETSGIFRINFKAQDGTNLMKADIPTDRINFPEGESSGSLEISWTDKDDNLVDNFVMQGKLTKMPSTNGSKDSSASLESKSKESSSPSPSSSKTSPHKPPSSKGSKSSRDSRGSKGSKPTGVEKTKPRRRDQFTEYGKKFGRALMGRNPSNTNNN